MSFDVSIVPCGSYDMGEVRAALSAALAPLGGLDWVRPGMKIAVKVNLISAMRPDAAATVHPALLTALTELLQERGASVVLGDSPGGLFTAAHLNRVYDVCGLRQCEQAGAALNLDTAQTEAHAPEAVQARTFTYTRWLDDADAIIDFCKLKTHGMLAMTNACKNFFGVIPGTMKPEYHCKYPKTEDFADMLVDLCEYFKPRLVLCDAVFAMEGNGPTQGHPRKVGAILAAESAHKLDLAAASLLGLTAQDVPTLAAALRRGLIPDAVGQLSISGDLAAHLVPDFVVPSMRPDTAFAGGGAIGKLVNGAIAAILRPYPKLHRADCVGCQKCAQICPAHAITMQSGRPSIDRRACIHCFCCQEFCPKGAMCVGRTPIARLLNK